MPSLSKTATRSSTGTSDAACSTNATIARLAAPSLQLSNISLMAPRIASTPTPDQLLWMTSDAVVEFLLRRIAPMRSLSRGRRRGARQPLELFFDLVYVFAIGQLSHHLLEHVDLRTGAEMLIPTLAVVYAWYMTRMGRNCSIRNGCRCGAARRG